MSYCPSQDCNLERIVDELTMLAEQFYKGDPEAAFEEAARFIAVRESLLHSSTEWAKKFWMTWY